MTTARTRRLLVTVGLVLLATTTFAMATYGCLSWRKGREIVIDFTESIDNRLVYPMTRETVIVSKPARVELRFPGGRTYRNDHAWEVWVQRNPSTLGWTPTS